jgi:hypothetical protein
VASVASEGVAGAGRPAARRLRAAVLGPRGGGTTRRRASDAFRLGFAVVVVAVSIPIMRANSATELKIAHALNPPPAAIRWLVTSVFWLGSAGVIVLLVILGLLVPRLAAIRWTAVAAVVTWAVCLLLSEILGPAAGRPATSSLAGLDARYPVTQLAVTIAVAATALPYLSRPDLSRRPLDPQECIHEAVASINVHLRRSGGAEVSYPKRIRAPPSKRRSHLRSHLRSWTSIGHATRSRRPAMPCRPLLREPDSARAAKPSASRASALPIYVMIPAKNQRGQPEENSRPSLDNGFGVQRLAAISASADASAVIPARTATVMTDVSGGTGWVSTVRIAATSMDNITVSEREGQAERAPSRPTCIGR